MKSTLLLSLSILLVTSCKKDDYSSSNDYTEPSKVYISSVIASPTSSESVTIKNNSGNNKDISGWTIGDNNNPNAYMISSNTVLSHGSYLTLSATSMGFQINNSGETIYLKNESGNLVDTWHN